MKKWLPYSLVISTALVSACVSKPTNSTSTPPKKASAPATIVPIVAEYRADAPNRYVVKKGDTLWHLSSTFLKNPARWKEIWHANPQIKNPNKIYPGDVISYVTVGGKRMLQVAGSSSPARSKHTGKKTSDGRPIYKLSPTIRVKELHTPIPTIPKEIVYPFVTKNIIVEPGFSEDYPYIVGQADGGFISLTGRNQVYARGDDFDAEFYDVFRESSPVKNPVTGELLAVEAVYAGKLKLVKDVNEDGIATFVQTDSVSPFYPKDILIPSEEVEYGADLNFLPKLPDFDNDEAFVIRPIGAFNTDTGTQFSTLLVNVGKDNGAEEGDVFKIVRASEQKGIGREGEQFTLPDYEVGIAIIYKVHSNTSYALVMNSFDVIYAGDRLVTP